MVKSAYIEIVDLQNLVMTKPLKYYMQSSQFVSFNMNDIFIEKNSMIDYYNLWNEHIEDK